MPPLSGRLWSPGAPFFMTAFACSERLAARRPGRLRRAERSAVAGREDGPEPTRLGRPALRRALEQLVEPLPAVERLHRCAQLRRAGATLDGPGNVLAADAQRSPLAVVRAEQVEMPSS